MRHPEPDTFIFISPILNTDGAYQWARDEFAGLEVEAAGRSGQDPYELMEDHLFGVHSKGRPRSAK